MTRFLSLTLATTLTALTLAACGGEKAAAPVAAAPAVAAPVVVAPTPAVAAPAPAPAVAVALKKDAKGCTIYPKDLWMAEADAKAKIDGMGYKVKRFLNTGNCYEIYGFNKEGKKAEVYFDAKTLEVVKAEID